MKKTLLLLLIAGFGAIHPIQLHAMNRQNLPLIFGAAIMVGSFFVGYLYASNDTLDESVTDAPPSNIIEPFDTTTPDFRSLQMNIKNKITTFNNLPEQQAISEMQNFLENCANSTSILIIGNKKISYSDAKEYVVQKIRKSIDREFIWPFNILIFYSLDRGIAYFVPRNVIICKASQFIVGVLRESNDIHSATTQLNRFITQAITEDALDKKDTAQLCFCIQHKLPFSKESHEIFFETSKELFEENGTNFKLKKPTLYNDVLQELCKTYNNSTAVMGVMSKLVNGHNTTRTEHKNNVKIEEETRQRIKAIAFKTSNKWHLNSGSFADTVFKYNADESLKK